MLRRLSVLPKVAGLPLLTELTLDPVGEVPPGVLAALEQNRTLSAIRLGKGLTENIGAHLADLARIPNLRKLDLRACAVNDGDLANLRPCLSLRELVLPASISDLRLAEIADSLPQVTDLDLSDCLSVTPAGLSRVTSIRRLAIGRKFITPEFGAAVAQLPRLSRLEVNAPLDEADFSLFAGAACSEISWSSRDSGSVAAQHLLSLFSLPHVRRFELCGTCVSDVHVPLLRGLRRGQQLRLVNTAVTDDGLLRVLWQLPDVDVQKERRRNWEPPLQ
jgi:hypothetical protein